MSGFELHPRLVADCTVLGDWPLSRLLLMDDARWPWCILVPRRAGVAELHELAPQDRQQLWEESAMLSRALRPFLPCSRLNVAALGNLVPQLHVHHVVRSEGDPAWPGPVWGTGTREPYAPAAAERLQRALLAALEQRPAAP